MKKINTKKKGFTIVELVIVIAVIGILAAILIPTFINLNNKAQAAANKSFVSEINKQLAINDALEEGNKDKFPTNNLYQVKKFLDDEKGFDVTKLSPVDGNELVWDQEANKFALIDKDNNIVFADFDVTNANHHRWLIVKDGSELVSAPAVSSRKGLKTKETASLLSLGYSVYLADNSFSGSIVLKAGFDAGENESIKEITYDVQAVQDDVIIRTFGGTLNLSGNNDVTHYGNGTKLNLDTTATYTERGDWDKSKLISGGMVVEEGSSLGVADVTEATANLTIVVKDENAIKDLVVDEANENFEVPAQLEEKKITKHLVSTFKELTDAVKANSGEKYIILANDIVATDALTIDKDVILDGDNHKLDTSALSGDNKRSINAGWDNEDGIEISLLNLIVDGPRGSYSRGINVASCNVKLDINNCTVNAGAYAINITGSGNNLLMNIRDSQINGWAAINIWAFYNEINVYNSILVGTNDKPYNANGWNNFSTICFEADTTCETDDFGYNNKVTLVGCTVKAIEQTEGNIQALLGFNGGSVGATSCILECKNCELVVARYMLYPDGQGNKVIVDDEVVWSN